MCPKHVVATQMLIDHLTALSAFLWSIPFFKKFRPLITMDALRERMEVHPTTRP